MLNVLFPGTVFHFPHPGLQFNHFGSALVQQLLSHCSGLHPAHTLPRKFTLFSSNRIDFIKIGQVQYFKPLKLAVDEVGKPLGADRLSSADELLVGNI
jgi:hypothetical protein